MHNSESILSRIQEPGDLRALSYAELDRLSAEIRKRIVSTVSRNGGHLASNLGVVELTIALHRVFNSPVDKIIWDVGHQCYTHKLLTGRNAEFDNLRRSGGISGFPRRAESAHDAFDTGHASTSISLAFGFTAGEYLNGGGGKAVAVVGDGALTGGLAYEGLSHAGQTDLPLVVILNDNKMSIGPNVGGLSKYLSRLSMKSKYQMIRRWIDRFVKNFPFFGPVLYDAMMRFKRGVKALFYTDNFFVDLGFEYVGPIDGHNIERMEEVLNDVKCLGKPVVVHVLTHKGRGYKFAEHDPLLYHGVSSFSIEDGLLEPLPNFAFTAAFSQAIVKLAARDKRVVGITAAMEKGTGLAAFKAEYPDRFFDVGIAEEHGVSFAAGLAARGLRPVFAVYSTFVQRSADQIIHDAALQNLPVTFALDRAGFVSDDGETHQGLFDISLFRSVPNISILSPACQSELELMLEWAVSNSGPAIIRYPKAACPESESVFSRGLEKGRGVFIRENGGSVCLAFTGSLLPQVTEAAMLLEDAGIKTDLYNLRFLKPLDEEYLVSIMKRYGTMVFIEEGMRHGGIGEYAASLAAIKNTAMPVLVLGAPDQFPVLGTRDELLAGCGLDGVGIARQVSLKRNIIAPDFKAATG